MQEPKHFIGIRHIAHPRIPRCVSEAVAETSEHCEVVSAKKYLAYFEAGKRTEDNNQDRVRRVHCNNNIRNQMATWRYHCNTPLPKLQMNSIVQQRRRRVSYQRRQEHQ